MSLIKCVISPSIPFKFPFHFLASQEVKVIPRKSFCQEIQAKLTREEGFTGKSEPAAGRPHLSNFAVKRFRFLQRRSNGKATQVASQQAAVK